MNQQKPIARLILFIVLGLVVGGVLGECLGALFGQLGELMNAGGYNNVVHNFFVSSFNFNIGFPNKPNPVVIDLYMFKIALGIGFKFNIVSVIGLFVGIYIMKWSGGGR